MATQEWLIVRSGKEFGPYDFHTLTTMARKALLAPTDTVINWATRSPTQAHQLPHLFPDYVPPSPSRPPAPPPPPPPLPPIENTNTPVLIALTIAAITICFVFLASSAYLETKRPSHLDQPAVSEHAGLSIDLERGPAAMSESTKGADLLNKCQGLPFLDMPGNEIAELPGDIQGQWFILAMSQDKGRNAEVIPAGEKNSQNWIFDSNSIQMSTNYGYLTGDLVPSDAEEMPNIELPFEQVLSFGDVEGMPTYALHANAGVFWFIHHDVEGEKVLWRSINLTENNEVARVLLGRDQP